MSAFHYSSGITDEGFELEIERVAGQRIRLSITEHGGDGRQLWFEDYAGGIHRHLSRLALPAVTAEQRECGGRVYTSGTSVVYAGPHGIIPRSQAYSPEEARALAAYLLAAEFRDYPEYSSDR